MRIFLHDGLECCQIGRCVRRLNCVAHVCFIQESSVQQNALAERSNGRQGRVQALGVLRILNGLVALSHPGQRLSAPCPVMPGLVPVLGLRYQCEQLVVAPGGKQRTKASGRSLDISIFSSPCAQWSDFVVDGGDKLSALRDATFGTAHSWP